MSGIDQASNTLAHSLRRHWPRDRPVLYHGTRYATSILRRDVLLAGEFGMQSVSFTRRPEVAVYWATMPRDPDADPFGSVPVFDRQRLRACYGLHIIRDMVWDNTERAGRLRYEEAEEAVLQDVEDLDRFLLDVVQLKS